MTVNKNKVITIPKALLKDENEFICPCAICIQREFENEQIEESMHQIKKSWKK